MPYRLGTSQTIVANTATSASLTAAFGAQTTVVRIASAAAVRFNIGAAGLVAATDHLNPAGNVDYILVTPGQKINAIGDSVSTVLFVTECS